MDKFLKDEVYYNDLYDLWTIEECLRIIEINNKVTKDRLSQDTSGQNKDTLSQGYAFVLKLHLHMVEGERYRNKFDTIQGWIGRDRENDKKLERTVCPENTYCLDCSKRMKVISKESYEVGDPFRVLFILECSGCKKRRGVFDNGEDFKVKPENCPKCQKEITVKYTRNGNVITWVKKCVYCGFAKTEIEDFDKDEVERKEKKRVERELLEKYRAEFCLSEKEGQEYIRFHSVLDSFKENEKIKELKRSDPDYKKADGLRKLKIAEVEKLLNGSLNREKYIQLLFDRPEIDKYIIVPFTVQDGDSARKDCDSERVLKRILKKILEGTNWRLMSDGVDYRLGYLSGRLKGYEHESDLLDLVKSETRHKSKL